MQKEFLALVSAFLLLTNAAYAEEGKGKATLPLQAGIQETQIASINGSENEKPKKKKAAKKTKKSKKTKK